MTRKAEGPRFVDVKRTTAPPRYESVKAYCEANGFKKIFVAERWGVTQLQMTALVNPQRYRVSPPLTEAQIAAIANDLNQPAAVVQKIYGKAA